MERTLNSTNRFSVPDGTAISPIEVDGGSPWFGIPDIHWQRVRRGSLDRRLATSRPAHEALQPCGIPPRCRLAAWLTS